ncbi:LysE family translocator [Longimicrobium sp.]|uniref:LysE family translocator n=1 Tax=Longimicrobium sp. TaxID=2029185 RepID=UPI002CEE2C95|nr:LysE family translocator [Longimicrobium sp.]HSU16978.1 LysE family translocator [Longimicrobium sp.]
MTWQRWGAFVVMEIVLSLTPGPAVLFVVAQGLRHGAARSLWANLGILSGNAFYFALSATGLGALLLASHDLFTVVKWAGAAYLVWLGAATFLGRGAGIAADGSAGAAPEVSGPRMLGRGFVLQAANPKALVFFTALLPQFIDPRAAVGWQVLILGASSVVAEFFVLAAYGVFAGRAARLAHRPSFARTTNRISGALLVGAGAGIALAGRR